MLEFRWLLHLSNSSFDRILEHFMCVILGGLECQCRVVPCVYCG